MMFMDFEASGLSNGFPIEAGWAILGADRRVTSEAHFVRCDAWLDQLERWDSRAEDIHKIPRRILLEFGKSPLEVASRMNEVLNGQTVFTDSPYDELWATMLFSEAGVGRRFKFGHVSEAFSGDEIDRRALEFARGVIDQAYPRTHRAAEDAAHWAHLYRMSLKNEAI